MFYVLDCFCNFYYYYFKNIIFFAPWCEKSASQINWITIINYYYHHHHHRLHIHPHPSLSSVSPRNNYFKFQLLKIANQKYSIVWHLTIAQKPGYSCHLLVVEETFILPRTSHLQQLNPTHSIFFIHTDKSWHVIFWNTHALSLTHTTTHSRTGAYTHGRVHTHRQVSNPDNIFI